MTELETKQMSSPSNILELDKTKINEAIANTECYDENGVTLMKWSRPQIEDFDPVDAEGNPENPGDENYLALIEKGETKYTGTLNSKFQREGFGLQRLENGDEYFGQFGADQRRHDGVYFWNPKQNEDRVLQECYWGHWAENKKDEKGIYVWMDDSASEPSYDNAVFDAYVGELSNEKYTRGTYLSKTKEDFYLYHGKFDQDGKKDDENAFFYTSQLNRIYHGAISHDLLVRGYIAYFDDEETVKELVYCEFNEDGSIAEVKRQKDLNEDDVEDEVRNIRNFRTCLFEGNYYQKIYKRYNKLKNFIKDKMSDPMILQDQENLTNIIKLLRKYNTKNIYYSIEENFFGREF